ncbi:probable WRKY transcription factor 48 [Ipomoea triloba]|uniref:probable WRKY transcription factor 48 n=1 Tax=Ipomoea triloba TaxID=35885 RepID=UPI00125CDB97|nr:probable WRKY transcription factor 48 [Ipomoea triloba]XP_031112382.1 probable WRKY transcription factor 48 [Ipomoea triloba]XP_031112391.1 probable WRKY transcription factor 48 [Ipomoea triloba]XP_031112399.1 probable WRKY transcription factor 48 [Ipomoea triloba]XP_031112403.1 probable WRKY transcription factor 48 [Ipomoea triloba]
MENKFDDLIIKRDSMGIPVFSDEIPSTSPAALQQALLGEADKTTYSLGFLDAQHNNNYYNTTPIPNTIFDLIIHTHTHTPPPQHQSIPPPPSHSQPTAPSPTSLLESSEVVNATPPTPNSSSLSSSSNEATPAANDDQHQTSKTVEEDEEDKTTKKQVKPKKKKNGEKRQREARFAFMTKSEVDQLDDGYRWRKYGQKAVKNTHFPRSYYRCTAASCGVKKRVERWCEDASIVVTMKVPTPIRVPSSKPRDPLGLGLCHLQQPLPPFILLLHKKVELPVVVVVIVSRSWTILM